MRWGWLALAARALPVALVHGLLGCAAIPWPQSTWEASTLRGPAGALDLRGVVHVHTEASHDSPGKLADVLAAARGAGVRWVALTEHTKPGRTGPYGELDGVVVLPGFEASAAGGSLLALGVTEPPPRTRDPAALVRWTRAAGGVAVVGHFERSRLGEPAAFAAAAPDAIELVNLHANSEARRGALFWRVPLLPGATALRTLVFLRPDNYARWAALPGPPPIVGAVDAHAKFRLLGPLGGTVDRYRDVFRLVTTHVWTPNARPASILAALRAGRSYVALESLGRVDAFRFEPTPAGYRLVSPRRAQLTLICDGDVAASDEAESALFEAPPGARSCHAEVQLEGRPWILTSPHLRRGARP